MVVSTRRHRCNKGKFEVKEKINPTKADVEKSGIYRGSPATAAAAADFIAQLGRNKRPIKTAVNDGFL